MTRRQPGQTRQAILDAAEQLFALNGYHGTSIRDIFKAAHVGTGLMTYYFASKDELFEEAINRKIDDVRAAFFAAFPTSFEAKMLSPYELIRKYLLFFLIELPDQSPEMGSYWNLISNISMSYGNEIVQKCLARFDFISDHMQHVLHRSVPHAPIIKIRRTLLLAEGTVITLKGAEGLIEHRLGPDETLESHIDHCARVLATGIYQ
jgi:AcrR family transcriptional regulator